MANNIDWSLIIILAISGLLFTIIIILAAGLDTKKRRKKAEQDLREAIVSWRKASDSDLIQAAADSWEKYPRHILSIIEAESKKRRLWEKIRSFTNEISENEDYLETFVCENCRGTVLNSYTGRCSACEYPVVNTGYCRTCENFFSIPPGRFCPRDKTVLIERKASTYTARLGNFIFDMIILGISAYLFFFYIRFMLARFNISIYDYFDTTKRLHKFIMGSSYIFLYYFIFESIWQRTPGKFITGTKIVDFNGRRPALLTIAQRTLIRFIPFEPFSYLGKKAYGWHDSWSGTYVVKARRFGGKIIEAEMPSDTGKN
jgi:uncharacterized RDD family membrane protein YckC